MISLPTRLHASPRGIRSLASSFTFMMVLAAGMTLVTGARGQAPRNLADDPSLTIDERRDATLRWLDTFLTESQLLRADDIVKIRDAVRAFTPSQLEQWLEQTKTLREYVEGEKWQQTKKWLREFLRVQNMYTERELQQLRNEIVNADADQMLAILKRIQAKHDTLVWMHQASEKNREMAVRSRDIAIADQEAAAAAARATSRSEAPLFGNTQAAAGGGKDDRGYRIPGPLINSRETARMSVWSELWGGGWFVGF